MAYIAPTGGSIDLMQEKPLSALTQLTPESRASHIFLSISLPIPSTVLLCRFFGASTCHLSRPSGLILIHPLRILPMIMSPSNPYALFTLQDSSNSSASLLKRVKFLPSYFHIPSLSVTIQSKPSAGMLATIMLLKGMSSTAVFTPLSRSSRDIRAALV